MSPWFYKLSSPYQECTSLWCAIGRMHKGPVHGPDSESNREVAKGRHCNVGVNYTLAGDGVLALRLLSY